MNRVYFNLGLNLPAGGMLDPAWVRQQLADDGFTIHGIKQSASEPTIIASLEDALELASIEAECLALLYDQDAVAWYCPDRNKGDLVGPKAVDWGPFNLDYFLMP